MELLKNYFKLQKEIYDYFGYEEDWVVIPLDDATTYHWILQEDSMGGGKVWFSDDTLTPELIRKGEQLYSNTIYTQRFLPRWIYRTEDYTMICVDTNTDGNKFLQIFDNSKEITQPSDDQLEALMEW